ncbi:MBL fold metallo-hydrolase [Paenibacillus daejeonensis]|uniref:MBL fold metallo-hydrolase n=1 Tax=Paenibacillus daejeonensis TaxID=135193 RepID=UPI000373236A|nr:MBL fold metallo-hydrolase [Paenibacillus daejeonensis]
MGVGVTLSLLAAGVLGAVSFVTCHPVFGGKRGKEETLSYRQSPAYGVGKFVNVIPTSMGMNWDTTKTLLRDYVRGIPNQRPAQPLPVQPVVLDPLKGSQQPRAVWLGHSAVLLEMEGMRMLLDPMLGRAPSPVPAVGGKRYSKQPPIQAEQLADIDVVLISHDHYDHLDYGTIRQLKDKVKRFIVPLGVGSHLERWGVPAERIEELDWWQETTYEGMRLACTPARHFSGRGLVGRDTTLWGSWVIEGAENKVFFSGDSGYGGHFKEIGERYGPFDLTLMECGQYDERWSGVHMSPEQTVRANLDVGGRLMVPIHWGAFTLAMHTWNDPAERAVRAAEAAEAPIATPALGEPVMIRSADYPQSAWWRSLG